jgi:hypothetical protein
MSARAKLIVERMMVRLDDIMTAIPPIKPGAAYWLDSDCGPSYCRKCVRTARGNEFCLGCPINEDRAHWRDEWEGTFFEGIDGGFDTTSDSTAACEICGCTLSYILTDYGMQQEADYYRQDPIAVLRDEDSYALDRLALNIYEGTPRRLLLDVAIIIGQAWRLLRQIEPAS